MARPRLLEPPVLQNFDEVGNRAVIEASFTLLDEQVKVLLWNAVIARRWPLVWFQKFSIPLI